MDVKVNNYDDADLEEIMSRLANVEHKMTLQELNCVYDFPKVDSRRNPFNYNDNGFYSCMSDERIFSTRSAPTSSISNPALRHVHRVLAHTLFGQEESTPIQTPFYTGNVAQLQVEYSILPRQTIL